MHSWWLKTVGLLDSVGTVHCRHLPCSYFMLWILFFYLQKISVKWKHVPWHFSTCKPKSCYPECKLRILSGQQSGLLQKCNEFFTFSILTSVKNCFTSHYLADSIVENIKYITIMHVRASHRIVYQVENELICKCRKGYEMAYLLHYRLNIWEQMGLWKLYSLWCPSWEKSAARLKAGKYDLLSLTGNWTTIEYRVFAQHQGIRQCYCNNTLSWYEYSPFIHSDSNIICQCYISLAGGVLLINCTEESAASTYLAVPILA